MTPSTVKKRRGGGAARSSGGNGKSSQGVVAGQRKREVFGLILMVLSVLVALAVATYNEVDDALAKRFSLDALMDPGDDRALNALGLTGAAIARALVPQFLGYCVLLIPLVTGAWGWIWFRARFAVYLPLVTGLTLLGAVFLATLFGWLHMVTPVDFGLWSGAVGQGVAGWMDQVFGRTGSFVLILLLLTVTVLLIVDRDIQRSLDRVENLVVGLRNRIVEGWSGYRTNRAHAKEERRRILAERRTAKQRDEALRATARAHKPEPKRAPEPRMEPPIEAEMMPPPPRPIPAPKQAVLPTADVALHVAQRKVEERTEQLPAAQTDDDRFHYDMPTLRLLDAPDGTEAQVDYAELEENKRILLDKLSTYNIEITEINAVVGPTVTLYELTPAPGIKISRITALENDLAMAMAARGIRMIAPIPGKTAIGVEIPNRHRELVRIRDVIGTAKFRDHRMALPLILGKSIEGEVVLQDLTKMPHVLIAGATGSGKSVGLNTFIAGLLYACPPRDLKFVMIDPKKIELQPYGRMSDHYVAMPPEAEYAIITDVAQALGTLRSCEREMELRYDLLSSARVRSIREYNARFDAGELTGEAHRRLPYIVVVVDELADLMMTAGKDIEAPIARLAQMSRAVGIHLILATQRPSVDVITGLIKANFPARIAYQVASKIDSRTILDQNGAEGLVGNGDLLYMLGSHITRLQGPFVSIDEVDRITTFIGDQDGRGPYLLPSIEDDTVTDILPGGGERDDLFEEAARIIVRSQQGSVSLLQRKLSVGYSRAARIVDQLEDAGIVGPFEGSKARQVRVADEAELDQLLRPG